MDRNAFAASAPTAPALPDYEGYIDQRSTRHIAGWARDLNHPDRRLELEIAITEQTGERIVARTTASLFDDQTIAALASRHANYAFNVMFDQNLTHAERDQTRVRIAGTTHYLPMASAPASSFEPINHIALDIVNNCNLRCPFCVYDYGTTRKTEFMTGETFARLMPLIPYVRDGNVWLSCLHEPTLHPDLPAFISNVPFHYRKKLIFTTNLAKRMGDDFFNFLAGSGIDHINISIESLQPAIYEKFRAGARFDIFTGNLAKLWRAFATAPRPPSLRYIILAYRSNLSEIEALTRYLSDRPGTSEIEIRTTMNKSHIPQKFRDGEFLTSAEWRGLDAATRQFGSAKIVKIFPPGLQGYDEDPAIEPAGRRFDPDLTPAPRPLNLRITWDGMVTAFSVGLDVSYFKANLRDMADPLATLLAL